jgi:hypothetical protein
MSGDRKILFTCTSLVEPLPPSPNVRRSDEVIVELLVVHLSIDQQSEGLLLNQLH